METLGRRSETLCTGGDLGWWRRLAAGYLVTALCVVDNTTPVQAVPRVLLVYDNNVVL